jgi:hypothetical protein
VDIEVLLRAVESRYGQALRAAVTAKAVYLALLDEPRASRAAIQHARQQWQRHDHTDVKSPREWVMPKTANSGWS